MVKHKTPDINVKECLTIQAATEREKTERRSNNNQTAQKETVPIIAKCERMETWSRRNEYGERINRKKANNSTATTSRTWIKTTRKLPTPSPSVPRQIEKIEINVYYSSIRNDTHLSVCKRCVCAVTHSNWPVLGCWIKESADKNSQTSSYREINYDYFMYGILIKREERETQ